MTNKQLGWRRFITLCQQCQSEQELEQLLHFFLTPEEQEQMNTRILVISELLKHDKPQRQIATDLNISISKITRGSNALKAMPKKLRDLLKAVD